MKILIQIIAFAVIALSLASADQIWKRDEIQNRTFLDNASQSSSASTLNTDATIYTCPIGSLECKGSNGCCPFSSICCNDLYGGCCPIGTSCSTGGIFTTSVSKIPTPSSVHNFPTPITSSSNPHNSHPNSSPNSSPKSSSNNSPNSSPNNSSVITNGVNSYYNYNIFGNNLNIDLYIF
ncbi:3498_t:CDS:2, partial [Gigaspora margarita]